MSEYMGMKYLVEEIARHHDESLTKGTAMYFRDRAREILNRIEKHEDEKEEADLQNLRYRKEIY